MVVVGRLRSLLRDLQRVRSARELVVVLGSDLLVRVRSVLRLRLPPELSATLSPVLRARRLVLVVGRLEPLVQPVGPGHAAALQVGAASRLRAAAQARRRRALANRRHGTARL